MRNQFPGHYRLTTQQFQSLWRTCTFVLDANVLLNVYRYPLKAREDFLGVLKTLSNRLWVPHQAAMEFQRNRLGAIAEQAKKFGEVRAVIEDAVENLKSKVSTLNIINRHSSIDPTRFLSDVDGVVKKYFEDLEVQRKLHIDVSDEDNIRETLDHLLEGKIGSPIQTQAKLDELCKSSEERYQKCVPPGYRDKNKEKQEISEYTCGGLRYHSKYGDCLVWLQTINHVRDNKIKNIVLVTDDKKDDWWLTISGKTIGPRPELIEEMCNAGQADLFYIYSSDQFIRFAQELPDVKVTGESISQISEVIDDIRQKHITDIAALLLYNEQTAKGAIARWLHEKYPEAAIKSDAFETDFLVTTGMGKRKAFEVVSGELVLKGAGLISKLKLLAARRMHFDEVYLIVNSPQAGELLIKTWEHRINTLSKDLVPDGIFIGRCEPVSDTGIQFVVLRETLIVRMADDINL